MRVQERDKCEQSIKNLENNHRLLFGKECNVVEVLTECQSAAIYLGNIYERDGGDLTNIRYYEEYCEYVYVLSQNSQKYLQEKEDKGKQLNQFIDKFKQFNKEISVKYDILFLPYKASMWDSMESIWKEAIKSAECNCIVMPIPYSDMDEHGNMQLKYEIGMFPDYVNVVYESDYLIEQAHPDAIIIHNPYDNYNLVTSVTPRYYTGELRKYTGMLVYVPYFITSGGVPDSLQVFPSYFKVDRILLQSDSQLDYYDKRIPRDKMLIYGSPKVDKIINYGYNDIPSSWKELIGDKKVFMYNTSLSGLLKNNKTIVLNKMLQVFKIFEKRHDVVLLWRPHPLSDATINMVVPEIRNRYQKIIEWYRDNKIGIFDDSTDITRAVCVADAYIGEETSSVVHLFGVLGKPIYVLNMDLIYTSNKQYNFCAFDYIDYGDYIWFVPGDFTGLFRYDKKSNMIDKTIRIPEESLNTTRSYSSMILYKNKLICAPMSAKSICEYDMNSEIITNIELKTPQFSNFNVLLSYGNWALMIPTYYDGILKYNMDTGQCIYLDSWICEYKKVVGKQTGFYCMSGALMRDNKILMASAISDFIMEIDIETGKGEIHSLKCEGINFWDMAFDGEYYWLLPNKGSSIVRWKYETGEVLKFDCYPESMKRGDSTFIKIVKCGKYMVALPKNGNMIIKINRITHEISQLKAKTGYSEGNRFNAAYTWGSNYYFAKELDDNHIVTMTAYDNSLVRLNIHSGKVKKVSFSANKLTDDFVQLGYAGKCSNNVPYGYAEECWWSLDMFINFVKSGNFHDIALEKSIYEKLVKNMDGTCGQKFFNKILKEVKNIY